MRWQEGEGERQSSVNRASGSSNGLRTLRSLEGWQRVTPCVPPRDRHDQRPNSRSVFNAARRALRVVSVNGSSSQRGQGSQRSRGGHWNDLRNLWDLRDLWDLWDLWD